MTPQRKTLNSHALKNTSRGLMRKLPLFLVAGLAVFILTRLDRAKTNYDISNDNARSTSFVVDETFLGQLGSTDATLTGWLKDPTLFKYRKFANRRTLLDALAETAVTNYGKQKSDLESTKKDLKDDLAKAQASLNEATVPLGKKAKRTRRAHTSQSKTLLERKNEVARIDRAIKDNATEIKDLEPALEKETSEIYNTFGDELPRILLRLQNRNVGLSDQLLKPVLNEKSSLYVVYQVFRVTAIIIVVLTFVFIFVMAISQLPLASGADTVSEKLKGLISLGAAGSGGEVAKTAIVSLAALGVGTAVVVGGNVLDGRSVYALPSSNVTIPGSLEEGDSRNAFFTENNLNSLYLYRLMQTRIYDTKAWPEFNPTFKVPPPTVINTSVADTEGTRAILNQLKLLIAQLKIPAATGKLQVEILNLEKMILALSQRPDDCKCEVALKRIGDLIYDLNRSIGGPPLTTPILSPVPTPAGPPVASPTSAPAASPTARPVASPTPMPLPTNETVMSNLKRTADTLVLIQNELKALRNESRPQQRADGRNLKTRTGQLFGSEYYWVSEWAYQVLGELLKGNRDHDRLTTALLAMRNLAPQEKSGFLKSLREQIKPGNDQELVKRLKSWEKMILNYTRLPG